MNATSSRRVCVITGSSAGIGAATALWFARHGHDVLINYSRDATRAEAVAARCREAGARTLVVQADIADDAQCRALADAARATWGGVDVLVNNAGSATRAVDFNDLEALSAADFQSVYGVNVIGTYQMCRAIVPLMKDRPGANIVNISSMAAVMGTGSSIAYAVSKGGVNTLTLALARSLAPIRVNAILPGLVNSDWLRTRLGEAQFEIRRQRYADRALLDDVIEPDDAAATAGWLATEAGKLTGQLIQLDAGFQLG
jgi:NAD(P)-dependent dehydrogenase (short-subunit alcohol dehydrogenase family)